MAHTHSNSGLTRVTLKDIPPAEGLFISGHGHPRVVDTPQASSPIDGTDHPEKVTPDENAIVNANDREIVVEWTYPDGGLRAWLVVLGCFLYAATMMTWGLIWGVLQDHYHTHMFPETSLSILSLAGGVQNLLMNGVAYLSGGLGDRYGYKRVMAVAAFLAYLSLVASAFSTKVYHLFLSQGLFLGIAQGLAMPLYVSMPSQWFFLRRGLATGLTVSGSGIGGGAASLIIRQLLLSVGFKKTMLIYSGIEAVIWCIALCCLKERYRPGYAAEKKIWLPKRVTGSFYSVALSVFIGIFGYLSPFYFITTYTQQYVPSIDPNSLLVSVPLVLMNFCAGLCRILAGFLADYIGAFNTFFLSFFIGGLMQIACWTFAKTFSSIIVFAVLNGLTSSGVMSVLPGVCAKLFGMEGLSTITGFMILANAPGQLAGAPIGGAIFSASGENWVAVTVYSGGVMMLGSLCILYARFSYDKSILARV